MFERNVEKSLHQGDRQAAGGVQRHPGLVAGGLGQLRLRSEAALARRTGEILVLLENSELLLPSDSNKSG